MKLRNGKTTAATITTETTTSNRSMDLEEGQECYKNLPTPEGYPLEWREYTMKFFECKDWTADKEYAFMNHLAQTSEQWMPAYIKLSMDYKYGRDWLGEVIQDTIEKLGSESHKYINMPRTRAHIKQMYGKWGYVQGVARLADEIMMEWKDRISKVYSQMQQQQQKQQQNEMETDPFF